MAARNLSLNFQILVRKHCQIRQFRSIHSTQLTQFPLNNNAIDNMKSRYPPIYFSRVLLGSHNLNCTPPRRWKYNRKKKSRGDEHDTDDEEEDIEDSTITTLVTHNKNASIINSSVSSMRIDAIVKAGFGLSRNKAEITLYEGKLRYNGKKPLKKGISLNIDDFIDLVHGPSPKNENFLLVSRLTILDAKLDQDKYKVKILKEKSLLIEKYDDFNAASE